MARYLFLISLLCSSAFAQDAVRVSVCDLEADPARYNHQLVEVQGLINHEFEDFSLHNAQCETEESMGVWLMYGGDAPDDVLYCCNGTGGNKQGVSIEGLDIPLRKDETYKRLHWLLNSYRIKKGAKKSYFQTDPSYKVRATVIGRFFAGKKGLLGLGFGHMGCCTLLAIQRVKSIDEVSSNLKPNELDCYSGGWSESNSPETLSKKNTELLASEHWRTTDARRVASEALREYVDREYPLASPLRFLSCRKKHLTYSDGSQDQYSTTCFWVAGAADSFSIEVMKFYFLKNRTNSWNQIVWMPNSVYHEHCEDPKLTQQ